MLHELLCFLWEYLVSSWKHLVFERWVPNDVSWPSESMQLWRYVADRTGHLSYANLPMLWLFSSRNNVISWITGWKQPTLNMFHRHVARACTLEAIVHSVAYTVWYLNYGMSTKHETVSDKRRANISAGESYVSDMLSEPWFYLGVVVR